MLAAQSPDENGGGKAVRKVSEQSINSIGLHSGLFSTSTTWTARSSASAPFVGTVLEAPPDNESAGIRQKRARCVAHIC